jgi:hypothetical protein
MSLWADVAAAVLPASVDTALRLADESAQAVTAARHTLAAGAGPLAALRAFAEATHGQLDDAAVAELDALARQTLRALDAACAAGAWLAAHESDGRATMDAAAVALFGAAYRAAAWRQQLRTWLEAPTHSAEP